MKRNAPLASKDKWAITCRAAVGVGDKGISRVKCLKKAGVDIIVIDTALWTYTVCNRNIKKNKNFLNFQL